MADLTVVDEGKYWESGNREELESLKNRLDNLLNDITDAMGRALLEETTGKPNEGGIEIGKHVYETPPVWRKNWGDSAGEN